jgi:NAD-dependent dihydropyrimidine dehydrogenase PreA subunit
MVKIINEDGKWFGIPREEIDWFPTINFEKCIGCLACLNKCTHGVYSEKDGKPVVVKPKNCIVGCTGCEPICPVGAISHPPKDYLQSLMKNKKFSAGCDCGGRCK